MITLFRLFKSLEMLVEKRPIFETSPIDSLKRLLIFISLVERTGYCHYLEGLTITSPAHVRTGAKIPKIAILEDRYFFVFRNIIKEVHFKDRFDLTLTNRSQPTCLCQRHCFVPAHHHSLERRVFLYHLLHLSLDLRKIIGRNTVL